jgi:low temperature requirement protein LtrA
MSAARASENPSLNSIDSQLEQTETGHGHFESIEGSSTVRLWFSDDKHAHRKRLAITNEFGAIQPQRAYDSLHYQKRLSWFHPLFPRQFYSNGVYYFAEHERLPSWDELFLDLVYVGVIYNISEILRDKPISLESLHHFFLVAIPLLNTWYTMNKITNSFGSSDMTFKAFTWIYHILVLLMSVYAPGVMISKDQALLYGETFPGTAPVFITIYFVSQSFILLYGLSLFTTIPRVGWSYLTQSILILTSQVPAMLSIPYPEHLIELWWTSVALYHVLLISKGILERRIFRSMTGMMTDFEHFCERYSLFTMVVMGEMFTAIVFHSTERFLIEPELSVVFGAIIAISIQFMYFTVDQELVRYYVFNVSLFKVMMLDLSKKLLGNFYILSSTRQLLCSVLVYQH